MSESEMVGEDTGAAARDLQEAKSIKFVLGLRLALLRSGNWAIYWGGPAGVREIEIAEKLDPERLLVLAQAEVEQRAEGQRLLRSITEHRAASTVQSSKSLEDMGL